MRNYYFLKAFLFVLLSIFILFIMELQFFDTIHKSFTNDTQLITFLLGVFLVFMFWISSIQSFYKFNNIRNQEKITQETDRLQLEESQKLIQTLRAQRHDFRNQLQVIKALAQLKKNAEIDKYIQDCNQTLDFSYSIPSKIENPAIFAMLLVFSTEAKAKGITFTVDSDLDCSNLNISPARLTRVLGNIIQNAIEILSKTPTRDRTIQITIYETKDSFCFLIWNNGPLIPEDILEKIFLPGFSTKESTGLGLSIVKELVDAMNGEVTVKSYSEVGTEFKVSFPKTTLPVTQVAASLTQ
jgi:two-component system, LytTR family, sensor histidine kinase AgrC